MSQQVHAETLWQRSDPEQAPGRRKHLERDEHAGEHLEGKAEQIENGCHLTMPQHERGKADAHL
jgi:hypothetical protein